MKVQGPGRGVTGVVQRQPAQPGAVGRAGGRQGKDAKCKESKGSRGKESVAREADMKGGARQGRDERATARVLLPPPQAPGAL